jgi:hypothetical protein
MSCSTLAFEPAAPLAATGLTDISSTREVYAV